MGYAGTIPVCGSGGHQIPGAPKKPRLCSHIANSSIGPKTAAAIWSLTASPSRRSREAGEGGAGGAGFLAGMGIGTRPPMLTPQAADLVRHSGVQASCR